MGGLPGPLLPGVRLAGRVALEPLGLPRPRVSFARLERGTSGKYGGSKIIILSQIIPAYINPSPPAIISMSLGIAVGCNSGS